jgi:hypothetical protein
MSLAAAMTCFTRRGADFGATALPWMSLALWPLTVGDGSVVPVPPLFCHGARAREDERADAGSGDRRGDSRATDAKQVGEHESVSFVGLRG